MHIGEGLLACTLAARGMDPRSASRRDDLFAAAGGRDIDLDAELPDLIRRYNESVGGVNSDSEGYHETITRVFLHGVRLFLERGRRVGAAARAGQRAAAVADGTPRLADALLLACAALLGRSAAEFHRARHAALFLERRGRGRKGAWLSFDPACIAAAVPDRPQRRSSRRRLATRTIYRHATLIDGTGVHARGTTWRW